MRFVDLAGDCHRMMDIIGIGGRFVAPRPQRDTVAAVYIVSGNET